MNAIQAQLIERKKLIIAMVDNPFWFSIGLHRITIKVVILSAMNLSLLFISVFINTTPPLGPDDVEFLSKDALRHTITAIIEYKSKDNLPHFK
ncbi:hypothetical protein [Variovorax sp. HJSM1_2]|uniref:hypothetical protein n=1 Tax=Variovorax sp. HJSM1_2 TaxID=3366263 RepID=UPI003BC66FE3